MRLKVCQSEAEEAVSSWKVIHSHRGVEDKEAAAATTKAMLEKNLCLVWAKTKGRKKSLLLPSIFWKLLLRLTGDEKVAEKTLGGFGRDLAFVGPLVAGTNSSDD